MSSKKRRAQIGDFEFLVQGTLYPDVIESVSVRGPSATIKSHHNVGGLPEQHESSSWSSRCASCSKTKCALSAETSASTRSYASSVPGPGPGGPHHRRHHPDKLALLQRADAIFTEEMRNAGWYERIWQASRCCCRCRAWA